MSGIARVDFAAVRAARSALARIAAQNPELRTDSNERNRMRWEVALETIMAAKKEARQDEQIVVRVPGELVERIDAYAERLRREQPGPAWRRSDVVRLLIARALDDAETKRRK